jgi:hypothetical protein
MKKVKKKLNLAARHATCLVHVAKRCTYNDACARTISEAKKAGFDSTYHNS